MFFLIATVMMIPWSIMKLITLDAAIVNAVLGKLCRCCKDGLTDRMSTLFMNFPCLQRYGKMQVIVHEVSKYLRFKVAANTMLWPLTTMGYNEKCPDHVFTQMPGVDVYFYSMAVAGLDMCYMLTLFCISAKKPNVLQWQVLLLPFVVSALWALAMAFVVLIKSNWSVVLGFDWKLSWAFELAPSFGMFQLFYLLLS